MTRRQQWMVGTIAVLFGLWMVDLIILEPIREDLQKGNARVVELEQEYAEARRYLELKDRFAREWSEVRAILSRDEGAEPQQALLQQLDGIEKRAKVNMDVEMKPEEKVGDFRETALEISLETDIRGVRDLLWELGTCREYIRISEFSVGARPFSRKNADTLRVDFRVSTIRFRPEESRRRSSRKGG